MHKFTVNYKHRPEGNVSAEIDTDKLALFLVADTIDSAKEQMRNRLCSALNCERTALVFVDNEVNKPCSPKTPEAGL